MNRDSTIISLVAIVLAIITMMVTITNKEKNKETIKTLWQRDKDINSQFIDLRTKVDILKGEMKIYENLPIDLRSRIEILETRYDNIIFFKNRLNEKEKKLLNKNIERLQNQSEKE